MKLRFMAFVLIVTVASVAVAADVTKPAASTTTLENLQAAFNGESNARARYLAFAAQAEKEGYGEVASLFRAAARAEEVHAGNHATVIKKMGGSPSADVKAPAVKSTKENLEAALQGETYERDTMYPDFLKRARADQNSDAVETLNLAKTAEAEHAKLYGQALQNLASLKGKGKTYYVCTICGFTTTTVDFSKCPSCFRPKDKYVAVS